MNKRVLLGVFAAVVASAVTAGIVIIVDGGERGTPVSGLTAPVDYGQFRLLPTGSVPRPCGVPVPVGLTQERVDIKESATADEFRDHDLFFEPPYLPTEWELAEAHAETVVWDDGSQTDSLFSLFFERPDYMPISIGRRLLAPDCQIERVDTLPVGQPSFTLRDIRGVPVVYEADLTVAFVTGGVLTAVESVAMDFDGLTNIADALITDFDQTSPPPP